MIIILQLTNDYCSLRSMYFITESSSNALSDDLCKYICRYFKNLFKIMQAVFIFILRSDSIMPIYFCSLNCVPLGQLANAIL